MTEVSPITIPEDETPKEGTSEDEIPGDGNPKDGTPEDGNSKDETSADGIPENKNDAKPEAVAKYYDDFENLEQKESTTIFPSSPEYMDFKEEEIVDKPGFEPKEERNVEFARQVNDLYRQHESPSDAADAFVRYFLFTA